MEILETHRLPIYNWATDLEQGAKQQAINLALHPYTYDHIAILADSHQGYGMPIGGVAVTKSVIIPEACGVDLGCGVQAVKTNLLGIDIPDLQKIVDNIKSRIPVGFSHRSESLWAYMPPGHEKLTVVNKEFDSACHQLGTLGGGK